MGSTPEEEMGECQSRFCNRDAETNLRLWKDGFVERDIELCEPCGRDTVQKVVNEG